MLGVLQRSGGVPLHELETLSPPPADGWVLSGFNNVGMVRQDDRQSLLKNRFPVVALDVVITSTRPTTLFTRQSACANSLTVDHAPRKRPQQTAEL